MPKVPEFNKRPLRVIYNPSDVAAPASMKQKNLIITLCERRKIPTPDLSTMSKGEAATILSEMLS